LAKKLEMVEDSSYCSSCWQYQFGWSGGIESEKCKEDL